MDFSGAALEMYQVFEVVVGNVGICLDEIESDSHIYNMNNNMINEEMRDATKNFEFTRSS